MFTASISFVDFSKDLLERLYFIKNMVLTFSTRRLIELIKKTEHNRILIHQDHSLNLKKIIEKEIDANILITTSDLRFTKGINQKTKMIPDLILYIVDPYESQELIKETINWYITRTNIIILGDRKSTKSIIRLLDTKNKFYTKNFLICFIPKQQKIRVNIETKTFRKTINEINLIFRTQEGLFSYRCIDHGTQFLLENIKGIKKKDKILDFGCGYGVIGIYLAKKYPGSQILMIDSNLRAINFAEINANLNDVKNVSIKSGYLLEGINGKFDKIVSNPPTHTRLEEVKELIRDFKRILKDNGEVYLVINRIVNYERFAEKIFSKVSIVAKNNQYKILKFQY
jgi:16S rRNA (guanine1207-N2)-methyltransferase